MGAITDVYPVGVLVGCETALVLFAAAFGGRQDAYWMAEAGLTATCVDIDGDKLREMAENYPAGWEFVNADAYEFVAATDRRWDVVSADPWTNQFAQAAEALPAMCRAASRAVILGVGAGALLSPPAGWEETGRVRRSDYDGGVFWAVLEPR